MDMTIAIVSALAFIAAWNLFIYRQSRGRAWSPLWMAFSATATAILFIVSGSIGYMLSRHDRFVAHTAWTGSVIWWQVGVGVGAAAVAVVLWRVGIRSISTNAR
jgi:uncharacterized membrane protein YhdT